MTDINAIFQEELKQRRAQNTFAPTEKSVGREDIPEGVQLPTISFDETTEEALLNAEYGPQQVESLLGFVVDYYLNRRLEGAAADVEAVRALHRLKHR